MVYQTTVSLIAKVGSHEYLPKDLAEKLEKVPKSPDKNGIDIKGFIKCCEVIKNWAIEDQQNRKKAEYSARSARLTI